MGYHIVTMVNPIEVMCYPIKTMVNPIEAMCYPIKTMVNPIEAMCCPTKAKRDSFSKSKDRNTNEKPAILIAKERQIQKRHGISESQSAVEKLQPSKNTETKKRRNLSAVGRWQIVANKKLFTKQRTTKDGKTPSIV